MRAKLRGAVSWNARDTMVTVRKVLIADLSSCYRINMKKWTHIRKSTWSGSTIAIAHPLNCQLSTV